MQTKEEILNNCRQKNGTTLYDTKYWEASLNAMDEWADLKRGGLISVLRLIKEQLDSAIILQNIGITNDLNAILELVSAVLEQIDNNQKQEL